MVSPANGIHAGRGAQFSFVDLGDSARVALMITPQGRGPVAEQALEAASALAWVLKQQPVPMVITVQTVFLRNPADRQECEQVFARQLGQEMPVTNYVWQPPCCGAGLAVEAWAIGGKSVRVERQGPQALAVSYDGVRWAHCGGIESDHSVRGVQAQTLQVLDRMRRALTLAGSSFEHVVRTWFYLGGITEPDADSDGQRYQGFNRARTDFYRDVRFCRSLAEPGMPHGVYPASTGIGMGGTGLVGSCLALDTSRKNLFLLPLENPQQTPAYAYHSRFSAQSPKFSRAMALVLGDYITTWVSGTASIVDSESRHAGDPGKQTEQTIDNIERLVAGRNFALHGVKHAGVGLQDLAKIRVYLKRPEDLAPCQAICQRRFGSVPAIYAVADVCRPELLVEIEGVAFSRRTTRARC